MTPETQLRSLATRLAAISDSDKETTGPLGYLIGAAYALLEAMRYRYLKGAVDDMPYTEELREVAAALGAAESPALVVGRRDFESGHLALPGIWLAGFYFNSALHRIAAGAERLGVHPNRGGSEPESIARVRRDVNKLKHLMADKPLQGAKGLLLDREVDSIAAAVEALAALVAVAEEKGLITPAA